MPEKTTKPSVNDKGHAFVDHLRGAVKELIYISETDSEIYLFVGAKTDVVSEEEIRRQTNLEGTIEERDFDNFFKRLVEYREWFGAEEIQMANRYADLKEMLETNLRDIRVFKIGEVEKDIFIVGIDKEGNLSGVRTKAVET